VPTLNAADPLDLGATSIFTLISHRRRTVKKVTITLHGSMTFPAKRTMEIVVQDGENVRLFAPSYLDERADREQIPWDVSESGFFEATDFSIDSIVDAISESIADAPNNVERVRVSG
jgi:hypothetical protein